MEVIRAGRGMPRQLRIEYPGAFYHVYSRGNQKQPIFMTDDDRYYFLKILRDSKDRFGSVIHLYCLMDSHYHLTMETPEGNLCQIMHFMNSSYAVYLNKKHERCGHLFQGRFKAILVQADAYARTLAKYIHGNPVRRRIVDHPEDYSWSSCQDYYGIRTPPSWLETSVVLNAFRGSVDVLKLEHELYLGAIEQAKTKKDFGKASRLGILGDDDFIDRIRRDHLKDRMKPPDGEIRELKRLMSRPGLSEIRAQVNKELGAENKLAKKCTIFMAHKHGSYKLREIGEFLGISPAAVSVSFRKIEREFASNEALRRAVDTVRLRISDSDDSPPDRGKS